MKGDLTRSTFDRIKHYSSVRMQQGRVQLDADWNEQQDIAAYTDQTEARDVIGACGAPDHPVADPRNFQLNIVTPNAAKDFTIAAGRIYVQGLLCENEVKVVASQQPDLPPDAAIVQMNDNTLKKLSQLNKIGTFIAYLDVWQRHVTALEDAGIRESALNGPDTATRLKTVWQVKLLEVDATVTCATIAGVQAWKDLTAESTGTLTAQLELPQTGSTPCDITGGGGFRGLENQLYRIEVHKGGTRGNATFKWSRDNGFLVTRIKAIDPGNVLTVEDTGKDAVLGFAPDQWVELLDDDLELMGTPGQLAQVDTVNPGAKTIVLKQPPSAVNLNRNPKVRRWDQSGSSLSNGVGMGTGFLSLEDGIQIRFADSGETYRSGDYWLVPARSSLHDIEWPQPGQPSQAVPKTPDGIRHYFCPLGVLKLTAVGSDFAFTQITDCRKLFAPLTGLVTFFYVGGDGQEARPGKEVPEPLEVGVADPQGPVAGALVRFRIIADNHGILSTGLLKVTANGNDITVATDTHGVASCRWELDVTNPAQRVEATLIESTYAAVNMPVRFNAQLSVAEEVAYRLTSPCLETAPGVKTVRQQLSDQIPGWPPQSPQGVTTIKDILDALLCKLDARKLPYDPAKESARWKDIADSAAAPLPVTVQDALDELVEELESSDIRYRPSCLNKKGTVFDRLKIDPKDLTISTLLDALVCQLDATHIPIGKSSCPVFSPQQSIQQALDALCARPGLMVTTGLVVFPDVAAGSIRSSNPIAHGHGPNTRVSISLAFSFGTEADDVLEQGSFSEFANKLALTSWIDFATPEVFTIGLADQRPTGTLAAAPPLRSVYVRWWALPATSDLGVTTAGGNIRIPRELAENVVLAQIRSQPGFEATPALAETWGIPLNQLNETLTQLEASKTIVLRAGRYFPQ